MSWKYYDFKDRWWKYYRKVRPILYFRKFNFYSGVSYDRVKLGRGDILARVSVIQTTSELVLNKISMLLSDDVLKVPSSQATKHWSCINAVGLV